MALFIRATNFVDSPRNERSPKDKVDGRKVENWTIFKIFLKIDRKS